MHFCSQVGIVLQPWVFVTVKEESFGAHFPPVVGGSLTFYFVSFAPETVDFRCMGVARISVGVTAGAPVGCDGNSDAVEEEVRSSMAWKWTTCQPVRPTPVVTTGGMALGRPHK